MLNRRFHDFGSSVSIASCGFRPSQLVKGRGAGELAALQRAWLGAIMWWVLDICV